MIGQCPPLQVLDGGGHATQSHYSLSFAGGSQQYVSIGTPAALVVSTGNMTAAAWFKTITTSLGGIFAKGLRWQVDMQANGHVEIDLFDGAHNPFVDSGLSYNDGAWHHVALVRDSGTLRLYLDGSQVGTASDTAGSIDSADPVVIGARRIGFTEYLSGLVDDAGLWTSALSAAQIAGLAAGTLDPASLSPAGLWRLEEGSGSTAADGSGNGNSGTLTNGPTWSSDVPAQLQ